MAKGTKTPYTPTYPDKYKGNYPIISKSSWELEYMHYCDYNPDVLEWSYEPVKIPYPDPTKMNKTQSLYIPDFLVTFIDQSRKVVTKLVEIKPLHEANQGFARNSMDAVLKMKNDAKWASANAWAMRRGIDFITLTEADMFSGHENRKPRQNPVRPAVPLQIKNLKPKFPGNKLKLSKKLRGSRKIKSSLGKISKTSRVSKITRAKKI